MKRKNIIQWMALALVLALSMALMSGCMSGGATEPETRDQANGARPQIPESLTLEEGVPQLIVYDVDRQMYQQMDMESYIAGVLAGEMRNDWPMEALKAQAILARTYALKFASEKQSQFDGADISTDIREAQAYDEEKINDRILKAVEETRGEVMSYNGELPYAWFHAHAGGVTELAKTGLEFEGTEPAYTQSVASPESDKAPTTAKSWTASFSAEEVGKAASNAGVRTGTVKTISIGEQSDSGRAVTLVINGKEVSAPSVRIHLDSSKMRSTLLSSVRVEGDTVTFEGRGYGHGVGMSQWGAYGMAEEGMGAEQIVEHYFKDVQVVPLWD